MTYHWVIQWASSIATPISFSLKLTALKIPLQVAVDNMHSGEQYTMIYW